VIHIIQAETQEDFLQDVGHTQVTHLQEETLQMIQGDIQDATREETQVADNKKSKKRIATMNIN
jgi:hypothetical protein